MDIDAYLNTPSAEVQKKKKYANFTIREIGGPTEIIEWRRRQEAKEALYKLTLKARDERIASFESETSQKLDVPTIHTTSWAEKQAFVKSERERLAKIDERVADMPAWIPIEEPKLTILQKIGQFFKNIWKNANF